MRYLSENEGPLAYLVLAAAGAAEYVFPPLPGDTLLLFGAFLAATLGYNVYYVYATMTFGSILGGIMAYGGGRWLVAHPSRLGFLDRLPHARRALHAVNDRFVRYGSLYLALNRFIPALRAFFFVGAGLARMPLSKVILYGGLSAALWNALLLGLGYAVGNNWDALVDYSKRYTLLVGSLLVLLAVGMVLLRRRRRQRLGL